MTWEWIGDHAKRTEKVAAVFNSRLSGEHVRQFVEFLYVTEISSVREKVRWAQVKGSNPYPATFTKVNGVPWMGQIQCGHNPFLFARLVDDLSVVTDANGNQRCTWKELPRLDAARVQL